MSTSTTIAAISTGLTNSGISIIRISGKDSLKIVSKIFTSYKKIEKNKIIYGKIVDEKNNVLDEVLVSFFKGPNSFTGEDICEINCHGGKKITLEILQLVLKNGASLAKPGEFSKRAFLNGKMDLSKAEAVIDLINSKTALQTKIASKNMQGKTYSKICEIKDKLIFLMANIEVNIDYPEYDYEELKEEKIQIKLKEIKEDLEKLLSSYENGKYIKTGVDVAILGLPNMGKSSLLNKLSENEKAIVTDIPGTTRDIVEETVVLDNIVLNLYDTAGIRNTEDTVEKIGVEKSLKKLDEVDLVIYLLSANEKISKMDIDMLSKIKNKGINLIVSINKMDKKEKSIFDTNLEQIKQIESEKIVKISTMEENGLIELKEKIKQMFDTLEFDFNDESIIINSRQKDLIEKSLIQINQAIEENKKEVGIDIISINIKEATNLLGEIIGTNVSEEVISKIFEKFCLGK